MTTTVEQPTPEDYSTAYLLSNASEYFDCNEYTLGEVHNYHPYELNQFLIEYVYEGPDTGGDDYLRQSKFFDQVCDVVRDLHTHTASLLSVRSPDTLWRDFPITLPAHQL